MRKGRETTPCQETKESTESDSDIIQMLEISEGGIRITIINVLNAPSEKFDNM